MESQNCTDTLPLHPSWREWVGIGADKFSRDLARLVEVLARCADRARQRRALWYLDDRMLKDMGISRADVWAEARKPPWRN